RLRVLLVATHGPGADERRFDLAVLDHLDRPAFVVLVLDDPCGPAIVAPEPGLVDHEGLVGTGGIGRGRQVVRKIGHCDVAWIEAPVSNWQSGILLCRAQSIPSRARMAGIIRSTAARPSSIAGAAWWKSKIRMPPRRGWIRMSAGSPARRLRVMRTCMMSMLWPMALISEGTRALGFGGVW